MTWRMWPAPSARLRARHRHRHQHRHRQAAEETSGWLDVAGLDDLRDNRLVVELDDVSILIVRTRHSVVAVENECPHLGRPLSDGRIGGRIIQCAAHGSRWDLPTGQSVPGPRGPHRRPLRTVPARLAGMRILLSWPGPGPR